MAYTKDFRLHFKSAEQVDALRTHLKSQGVEWEEAENLVEESRADYQTVDPALLEMTEDDWENVRLGDADIEAGRTVPWAEVKQYLEATIQRLTESPDAS